MSRIKIEDVKGVMEKVNWSCETNTYQNLKTLMQFRCPEGHLVESTWAKMRNKQECPVCRANAKVKISDVSPIKKTNKRRVLALDQASYTSGWSVYDDDELIGYGMFTTRKNESILRILDVCDWLASMIHGWQPDLVGIEDIQYNPRGEFGATGNHNTFKLLGQLMGALMITSLRGKRQVESVNNKVWKAHCQIKGATRVQQKASAQKQVKKWHDISVDEDVSDAICIGKYFAESAVAEEKKGIGEY